jgi:hypothetical protein
VEGAEPRHGAAGTAEGDVGADYFLDPSPVSYGGDVFLVDPPTHGRESMSQKHGDIGVHLRSSEGFLSVESARRRSRRSIRGHPNTYAAVSREVSPARLSAARSRPTNLDALSRKSTERPGMIAGEHT